MDGEKEGRQDEDAEAVANPIVVDPEMIPGDHVKMVEQQEGRPPSASASEVMAAQWPRKRVVSGVLVAIAICCMGAIMAIHVLRSDSVFDEDDSTKVPDYPDNWEVGANPCHHQVKEQYFDTGVSGTDCTKTEDAVRLENLR